jgi:nucleoside-triphosphatase THEP1
MRSLIKIGLLLLVGILVYNYFFGTLEEKETSTKIFHQIKELSTASWSLLKSEKAKLDQGKYDTALNKLENIYSDLRNHARTNNDNVSLDRIRELDLQRQELEQRMQELEAVKKRLPLGSKSSSRAAEAASEEQDLKKDMKSLLSETETLMRQMEN